MDELLFDAGLHSQFTYHDPSPQFQPSEEDRKKVSKWINERNNREEHSSSLPARTELVVHGHWGCTS